MTDTVPDRLTATTLPGAVSEATAQDTAAESDAADLAVNGAVMLRPRRGSRDDGGGRLTLRHRVDRLRLATVAELERRHEGAALEPADSVPVAVRQLSSLSRELPRLAR